MNYLVIGGLGFIGSHVTRKLISEENNTVFVYDNYSSGKEEHLEEARGNKRLRIIKGDIKDLQGLSSAMKGMDVVYSLASNPDIAKAESQPDIDFWEGTYLINNVLEAMRINEVKTLIYASGSGVYGDVGNLVIEEDYSPKLPISTYGASKLACEALICSYCNLFNIDAAVFRFANVVGPNQTHGVVYDFVHKIKNDSEVLEILGDGQQSKSYIYIDDVINALQIVQKKNIHGFEYYNVATLDYITVKEIAEITANIMNASNIRFKYTGGKRGWRGDVPIVRLDSNKIRSIGWENKYSSHEAIKFTATEIFNSVKK